MQSYIKIFIFRYLTIVHEKKSVIFHNQCNSGEGIDYFLNLPVSLPTKSIRITN